LVFILSQLPLTLKGSFALFTRGPSPIRDYNSPWGSTSLRFSQTCNEKTYYPIAGEVCKLSPVFFALFRWVRNEYKLLLTLKWILLIINDLSCEGGIPKPEGGIQVGPG